MGIIIFIDFKDFMRFNASSLLVLLVVPALVLFSHAEQIGYVATQAHDHKKSLKQIQGVYIQIKEDQLLKTPNETYLLSDKDDVLKGELDHKPEVVFQSFRVCLTGVIKPNFESNSEQYPLVFKIHALCTVQPPS